MNKLYINSMQYLFFFIKFKYTDNNKKLKNFYYPTISNLSLVNFHISYLLEIFDTVGSYILNFILNK